MVVTNDAKNRVRDLIVGDVSSMELGTDGSNATANDSALGAGVPVTNAVPVITTGTKTLNISNLTASTIGNGYTYREMGIMMNGDAVLLDRAVFPDLVKTDAEEITIIDLVRVN